MLILLLSLLKLRCKLRCKLREIVKNLDNFALYLKRRERDGTLKRKSCLSDSEFFFFSGIPDWSSQKSAALIFSFVTFSFASRQKKSKNTYTKIP